jgi:hypothetical protein
MTQATRVPPHRLSPTLLLAKTQNTLGNEGLERVGSDVGAADSRGDFGRAIAEARASIDRLSLHDTGGGGGGGGGRRDRRSSMGTILEGRGGTGAGGGVCKGEESCKERGNGMKGVEGGVGGGGGGFIYNQQVTEGGLVRPQFRAVVGSWLRAKGILEHLMLAGDVGTGARGQSVVGVEGSLPREGGWLWDGDGRRDGVRGGGQEERSNGRCPFAHVAKEEGGAGEEEEEEENTEEKEEQGRALKASLAQLLQCLSQLKTMYSGSAIAAETASERGGEIRVGESSPSSQRATRQAGPGISSGLQHSSARASVDDKENEAPN